MCQGFHAVVLWNNIFIGATYLDRPPDPPDPVPKGLNWSGEQRMSGNALAGMTDSIAVRLKGYVGWLVTHPEFIRQRDTLASEWHALAEELRPYPIVRLLVVPEHPAGGRCVSKALAAYQRALNAFLDLWGLTRMLTWGLPEPQGPMLPACLPADAPAIPKHGLHLVLPAHYPLTGTDNLLLQIQQQQVALAQEQGIDSSAAGLPHFGVYGHMLEVDLLEQTIRSRYGRPKSPPGLVTALEHSIAEAMELSVDQVQRLRKGISACRKGRRATVKWLKTSQ
jgi:hypothetical protein